MHHKCEVYTGDITRPQKRQKYIYLIFEMSNIYQVIHLLCTHLTNTK